MQKLYLAGGLFSVGERLRNAILERHLRALGFETILPQREAMKHLRPSGAFDLAALREDCRKTASDPGTIVVASLDGATADDGTAVEYALGIAATGRAITYRTDFRTSREHEIGANAMLFLDRTEHVYFPCFAIEEQQFIAFWAELANKIAQAARRLEPKKIDFAAVERKSFRNGKQRKEFVTDEPLVNVGAALSILFPFTIGDTPNQIRVYTPPLSDWYIEHLYSDGRREERFRWKITPEVFRGLLDSMAIAEVAGGTFEYRPHLYPAHLCPVLS